MKVCFTVVLSICCILSLHARTLQVPSQYSNIQSALNDCAKGDTVLVDPGNYYEHIIWPETGDIKLYSSGDKGNTSIDGSKTGRILTFDMLKKSLIDVSTEIKGFTIIRGFITLTENNPIGEGGAVYLNNAGPKFSNCNFTKNAIAATSKGDHPDLTGYGAAVYCSNSSPIFKNCMFKSNALLYLDGYGIVCAINSTVSFDKCKIIDNNLNSPPNNDPSGIIYGSGSIISIDQSTVTNNSLGSSQHASHPPEGIIAVISGSINITNSLFQNNKHALEVDDSPTGNVLYINNSDACISQVTTANNGTAVSGTYNTSLYYEHNDAHTITVQNSIFWNNHLYISEIGGVGAGTISVIYSDINMGYPGTGNIDENPDFISGKSDGDKHLQDISPCAGAGTLINAPNVDLEGNTRPLPSKTAPDMGAYEVDQSINPRFEICSESIAVFPNLAYDYIIIELPLALVGSIMEFYNSLGQIIFQTPLPNSYNVFNGLQKFPDGIYILEIKQGSKLFFTKKLILER
ncbi:MAG: T9SS type A sorting domain-containing protein [Chitinophagales bacterium]|nr:T9SS type A sorting domain-containing protein [Chitinophagales bacterium]